MADPSITSTFAGSGNQGLEVGYSSGKIDVHFSPSAERPRTLPSPSSTVPFRRDSDFVVRGTILDQLHQKCASPASRTALVGLGGVGKSQLAIEYGYRIREQSPETWVFWVHAGSTARVEQSYRDIADHVKIPSRRDPKANIFKLVFDWLRDRSNGKWLLILDNVEDSIFLPEAGKVSQRAQGTGLNGREPQLLFTYLPQCQNGSVLVTTRSRGIARKLVEEGDIVAVEPMAESHALALFDKKLGLLNDSEAIAELAAALELMPLAIVQAAAYISQRAPWYSVRQYLEDFRKNDRKKTSLLNYEGGHLRRDPEAKNSIIITWQISFEHIHQTRPSATDLLSLMSFFDRQGIPKALIRAQAENRNGDRSQEELNNDEEDDDDEDRASDSSEDEGFEEDLQVLRNYSFVSIDTDLTFEMHALVQLATRKWLEASGQLERWKQQYIKRLSAEFPPGDHKNWTRCQALFPHAQSAVTQRPRGEESLRDWTLLLYNAASYAWSKGSIAEAEKLSITAMKNRKKVFGQEDKETLQSMQMVGLAYSLGGRWDEAEKLQTQAMETNKRVLGPEHPSTLTSMNNLASTYSNQGWWEQAEKLGVQVMDIRKRVLSAEHPDTLTCMNNLAFTWKRQGRWEQAEELEVQVMEIRKRVLGTKHPNTLNSMNNLTFTWRRQGRIAEAIKLMEECVYLRAQVLGVDHPDTLSSSAALARWQR